MDFNNVFYLILGGLIGYRVAKLEINLEAVKKEVDDVDSLLKHRNQRGFVNIKSLTIGALVLATSFSSIIAGIGWQRANKAVDRMETIGYCTKYSYGDLLVAVNERAGNTKPALKSNIEFQKAFSELFDTLLHVPPYSPEENRKTAEKFHLTQDQLINKQQDQLGDVKSNPLPTIEQYNYCLRTGENKKLKGSSNESQ